MNKEAILQETYDSAFNDELDKIAGMKILGTGAATGGLLGGVTGGVSGVMSAEKRKKLKGALVGTSVGLGAGALAGGGAGAYLGKNMNKIVYNARQSKKFINKDLEGQINAIKFYDKMLAFAKK